jgi:hypothetical protein
MSSSSSSSSSSSGSTVLGHALERLRCGPKRAPGTRMKQLGLDMHAREEIAEHHAIIPAMDHAAKEYGCKRRMRQGGRGFRSIGRASVGERERGWVGVGGGKLRGECKGRRTLNALYLKNLKTMHVWMFAGTKLEV